MKEGVKQEWNLAVVKIIKVVYSSEKAGSTLPATQIKREAYIGVHSLFNYRNCTPSDHLT